MRHAEQLKIEPEWSCPTDHVAADTPLDISQNPFSSSEPGSRIGRPAQAAFGELIRLIALRTRVVVVLGKAGTGKTVLAGMVEKSCGDMGLSVRRLERGDLLTENAADGTDVLVVDEADSMSVAVLQSVLSAREKHTDRTIVFMCLPSCIGRFSFSGTDAVVVELGPLSLLDARLYLTERGNSIGRPKLFPVEALDVIIDASKGVPRLLRSIAGLAYFNAAIEGACQIAATHAEDAARMRNELGPAPSNEPSASNQAEIDEPIELTAADEVAPIVVANAKAPDPVAAEVPPLHLDMAAFGRTEAPRAKWSSRASTGAIAAAVLLLVGGVGAYALMNGHPVRTTERQHATASTTIALAPRTEMAAPQPSSETTATTTPPPTAVTQSAEAPSAPPSSEEKPAALVAPPPQSTPVSAPSAKPVRPSVAAKVATEDLNICALRQSSRDPKALPLAGRCPDTQLALFANATAGTSAPAAPPAPEIARVTAPESAPPATDAVTAPQGMPRELIRRADATASPPQIQREPAPRLAVQPQLPRTEVNGVQTENRGEVARDESRAPEQREAQPLEEAPSPVVIFGYRLW